MRRLIALVGMIASPVLAQTPALAQTSALAQTILDPGSIDRAVAEFTGAPSGAPGGAALPVDRRLRLIACASPLALSLYGARHDAVLVQCPTSGWRLYVPLKADPATPAATPAIMRGDAVTISLGGEGFAVSQPGEAMEAGPVGGWIKVRALATGSTPLRAKVIRPGLVGIELP